MQVTVLLNLRTSVIKQLDVIILVVHIWSKYRGMHALVYKKIILQMLIYYIILSI